MNYSKMITLCKLILFKITLLKESYINKIYFILNIYLKLLFYLSENSNLDNLQDPIYLELENIKSLRNNLLKRLD